MDKMNRHWGMHRLLPLLFSAIMLLTVSACVEEHTTPPAVDETTITFSVSVPNGFTPSSYGFSKNDEEYLGTVDVLLFNSSGNYVSGPHYGVIDETKKKVAVRIPDTDGDYTMAVFANCRSALNTTFSGAKETIYSGLTVNKSTWGTGVSGNPAVPNEPIPMWGEASVTVANGTVSGGGNVSVDLIRMLARINIANTTAAGVFTLTSVNLYNRNTYGRIAPKSGDASVWDNANKVAKLPSLPGTVGATRGPLAFGPNNVTGPNGTYNGEIYTFEANKGTDAAPANNPCLVIGGTYGGSTYYYRIDLVDANCNYLDLLRNHTYDISINQIGGVGYSDPATAFASRPVNITYTVSSWNNGQVGGIVTDGQYSLSVSAPTLNFDATERTTSSEDNILTITCNYGTSVTISSISSAGNWLSVRNSGGTVLANGNTIPLSSNQAKIRLTFGNNSGGATRTGSFVLTAGRMSYTVNVEQSNQGQSEVNVVLEQPANSYILDPYTQDDIYIPILQAYKALNTIPGGTGMSSTGGDAFLPSDWFGTGDFVAELVWRDKSNLNLTYSVVGTGESAYLKVGLTSSAVSGNAVIGIRKKNASGNAEGGFLWSWHLWVTDYNPGSPASGYFMNRNLGATSATAGNSGTIGLHYQWGRKDPFPASTTLDEQDTEPTLYFGNAAYSNSGSSQSGEIKRLAVASKTSSNYSPSPNPSANHNLGYSVSNPHIFYFNSSGTGDWYATSTTYQNRNLWGGDDDPYSNSQSKTVYDPCPPGWRVPAYSHWTTALGGQTGNTSPGGTTGWSWGNCGFTVSSGSWVGAQIFGSYFPAAGFRYGGSGELNGAGLLGSYWSASPNVNNGRFFSFDENNLGSPGDDKVGYRANGFSIRCSKE